MTETITLNTFGHVEFFETLLTISKENSVAFLALIRCQAVAMILFLLFFVLMIKENMMMLVLL